MRFRPHIGEKYYKLNSQLEIEEEIWAEADADIARWNAHNCFNSSEQVAIASIEMKKLLIKLNPDDNTTT